MLILDYVKKNPQVANPVKRINKIKMTKREEYNLEFYNVLNPNNNSINHICKSNSDDSLIHLQFMDQLKKVEIEYLIDEIKNAQNGEYYEDIPLLDLVSIKFNYPDAVIENDLVISMYVLKDLLLEWLDFMNSTPSNTSGPII